MAEIFVNQVISKFGVPLKLHTDQGRNFDSRLFLELSLLLGIKKTKTIPFHPQSNGIVKRQHQIITNYLAKFISENQRDWDCFFKLTCQLDMKPRISPTEMCFDRKIKTLYEQSPTVIV